MCPALPGLELRHILGDAITRSCNFRKAPRAGQEGGEDGTVAVDSEGVLSLPLLL